MMQVTLPGQLIGLIQRILHGTEGVITEAMPGVARRIVEQPGSCTDHLSNQRDTDTYIQAIMRNTPPSSARSQPPAGLFNQEAEQDEWPRHEQKHIIGEHRH